MNIMFWNLKRNDLSSYIKDVFAERSVDIAVFAEHSGVDRYKLSPDLLGDYIYVEGYGGCDKIALFMKSSFQAETRQEQSRYALYKISDGDSEFLLAGVHLQDRRNSDTAVRIRTIARLVQDIKNLEDSTKIKKTIVIGDFNANPYDEELLQVDAFNAVLYKDLIRKSETSTIAGEEYRRFYNPILNYLSESDKMYGSYYDMSSSASPIWHCLDQIIVSKALIDKVNSVQYLRKIRNKSLIAKIKPDEKISDHLPLLVNINFL